MPSGMTADILFVMAPPRKRVKVQRLEVHLDPPQLAWLRKQARSLDVSIAEVIRRLVSKEMEG